MNTKNKGNGYEIAPYITEIPRNRLSALNSATCLLHTSHNSTISNESDVSLLSLSLEKEIENRPIDIDELPAFEIRLISPLGRSPSPIDSEDIETPTKASETKQDTLTTNFCRNNPEFVALHDINAQISPPSDNEQIDPLSPTSSLETIYEGVFLDTPPRNCSNLQHSRISRSRTSLLEKLALTRLNTGKENQSPSTKCEMPSRRASIGFFCESGPYPGHKANHIS